ncbi:MAG: DUF2079 domain-containing protein [Planctomycetota bacterium]|nr:DUF2079 domain-containing protein [Planctomycetota bacterium]MDA1211351.1 DUF2079 domain-containing protein [Planctomycetota bacterium]
MPFPSETESSPVRFAPALKLRSAFACVVTGSMALSLMLQSLLSVRDWSATFISPSSWQSVVQALGAKTIVLPEGGPTAEIGFVPIFGLVFGMSCAAWLWGAFVWQWNNKRGELPSISAGWSDSLSRLGWNGWRWLWLAGSWEILRITAFLFQGEAATDFLIATPQFWLAISLAGWLTELFTGIGIPREEDVSVSSESSTPALRIRRLGIALGCFPRSLWIAVSLYVVIFTVMNWQLYRGLLIPHGDSAMYEEHLWNLLHGKGFRSYLDQGLFLGEHIQVIHLLLIPFYIFWPSHLLLELCQSVILALGALPVYTIARRQTGSSRAATCLACTYLLYFPMHYLDIAIDLKTFRPTALAVPILLATIDQFERRHFRLMWIGVLLTLSAQEDFSIILACWGLWMLIFPGACVSEDKAGASTTASKHVRRHGIALLLFNVAYLIVVLRYVIPWFRDGAEIHYSSYFSKFGKTIPEIVSNVTLHPMQTLSVVVNANFFVYALALLVPLGFLPLKSWRRLLVSFPLFVTLCLNEIAANPRHHFHAPIIPFLFWTAAAGLGLIYRGIEQSHDSVSATRRRLWLANWTWTSGLATALFFSLSPLGIAFWDAGSMWNWRNLYIPGTRAAQFSKVFEKIPRGSRVASTDFIHPRFTHHERSYDYSHYKRKVSDFELTVPDDTEYIVIDTQHPYSEIKTPAQIREYREHPDRWELLSDDTDGYYIVLKRQDDADSEL